MTETNMILSNPYQGERRPGSVGLPLPGIEVRAVADSGTDEQAGMHPPCSGGGESGLVHVACLASCQGEVLFRCGSAGSARHH